MDSHIKHILFVCTHNSARSQMAEGLVNYYFSETWKAESAGTEATIVNPFAKEAMASIGIDISSHFSKTTEHFKDSEFDVVVTVCDNAQKEQCPYFPGGTPMHKSFPDPTKEEDTLQAFCKVREQIKQWLVETLPNL